MPISSVITMENNRFSTQYNTDDGMQTAQVWQDEKTKAFYFSDHDSLLSFNTMQEALCYLFELYGI